MEEQNKPDALATRGPVELTREAAKGKVTRAAAYNPVNLTEAIALSKLIAGSELAPKDYKGKPANVLIAMQMGAEVGLAPMQAIQNIAVINGRPSLWGDAALAIVQASPNYGGHKEWMTGEGNQRIAHCQVKRKGDTEAYTSSFSVADAMKAQLWTKAGPWQQYPQRMLQMRARGFALRDKFADALRGLILAEEAMDIPPDQSEAKRQRELATLDIGTQIESLAPSSEPNRGHGDEGMQRSQDTTVEQKPPKKADDVMCSECRVINGHKEDCPVKVKEAQDSKTSRPTLRVSFTIGEIKSRTKRGTDAVYLIVSGVGSDKKPYKAYVWDTKFHEHLVGHVGELLVAEISKGEKEGSNEVFYSLDHILAIGDVPFFNDAPVTAQGEMPDEDEDKD